MSIFRNVHTLLEVSDATDEAQTGSTYAVLPQDGDKLNDAQQGWHAFFDLTQSGGATSPTTDAILETSHDGTNWVEVVKATQLTQDGEGHEFKAISALGPYVRAVTAVGGATAPNHTATVKLASNGPFRLKAVA